MARYFFHLRETGSFSEDLEGAEFESDRQAKAEAVQAAREMLAEKVLEGSVIDGTSFEVTRADGSLVETIPFRSVLRLD